MPQHDQEATFDHKSTSYDVAEWLEKVGPALGLLVTVTMNMDSATMTIRLQSGRA